MLRTNISLRRTTETSLAIQVEVLISFNLFLLSWDGFNHHQLSSTSTVTYWAPQQPSPTELQPSPTELHSNHYQLSSNHHQLGSTPTIINWAPTITNWAPLQPLSTELQPSPTELHSNHYQLSSYGTPTELHSNRYQRSSYGTPTKSSLRWVVIEISFMFSLAVQQSIWFKLNLYKYSINLF